MSDTTNVIPASTLAALRRRRERMARWRRGFVATLPKSYPPPRAEQEWQAYRSLRGTWPRPMIRRFVEAYGTDDMFYPGSLDSPGRPSLEQFMDYVGLLSEGERARRLPEPEMLVVLAGQDAAEGRKYRNSQSERGRDGATARWSGGAREEVDRIIRQLAVRKDTLGDYIPPSELWPELYAEMDAVGLDPIERGEQYIYSDSDSPITYTAFRQRVRRIRNSRLK